MWKRPEDTWASIMDDVFWTADQWIKKIMRMCTGGLEGQEQLKDSLRVIAF